MPWVLTISQNGLETPLLLPTIIGRCGAAEMKQQPQYAEGDTIQTIPNKYLSRVHLKLCVSDETEDDNGQKENAVLVIEQFGKNPSFFGAKARVLSHGNKVLLKPTDISVGDCVSFPRELNLPKFFVEYRTVPKLSPPQAAAPPPPVRLDTLIVSVGNEDDDEDSTAMAAIPLTSKAGSILDQLTAAKQASLVAVERVPSGNTVDAGTQPPSVTGVVPAPIPKTEQSPVVVGGLTIGKGWGVGDIDAAPQNTVAQPRVTAIPIRPVVAESVVGQSAAASAAPVQSQPVPMGFWEWKAHLKGDDAVAANWKPYKKALADVLEAAYCNPLGQSIVHVDTTYAVCFDDKDVGMVQYRLDDHTRWRPVRRRGGGQVDRKHVKRVRVIYTGSDDDSNDSEADIYAAAKKNVKKKKNAGHKGAVDSDDDDYVKDGWLIDDEEDDLESDSDSSADWDGSASSDSLTESSSDAGDKRTKKKTRKDKGKAKKANKP